MAKGKLSIHTENIFPIIKKWLYSEQDIFLRELIANSVDALHKRKNIESDIDPKKLKIRVELDKKQKILKVIDSGLGMDKDEVKKYINQIAFSGAEDFVSKYKDKNIIGHFGLGFYSSFMVSEKVEIETLSVKPNAEPVHWECEGETEYKIKKGCRIEVGTTVKIHFNNDSKEFAESYKISSVLEKYCSFMPFPIEFENKVVNQKEALWLKNPKDVKPEEYKEFYKGFFHDFEDPLFWIHLNIDFPFSLKGILYFPKVKQLNLQKGEVKLFCNKVFVADNLKELMPEFLLLLRGGIDIPDIPLNVSRSFLQHDTMVQKIKKNIMKKISDQLKTLFKTDKEEFEKTWSEISVYIKYGLVTEDSFFDSFKEFITYKTSKSTWEKVLDCATDIKDGKKKIYYTQDETSPYLQMFKDEDILVIFASELIDTHLFQKIEAANGDITFIRVDAEINENLVDNSKSEIVDKDNKTTSQKIQEVFATALENDKITIQTKSFKSDKLPAIVVFDEYMRRFTEMNSIYNEKASFPQNYTLVINVENPTVKKIYDLSQKSQTKKVKILCNYINDLVLIKQKSFSPEGLQKFLEKSTDILQMI